MNRPVTPWLRGDVWLVRLEPIQTAMAREQAGMRPALVVSSDAFNSSGMGLVAILPITTKFRPYPSRIAVAPPEGGLTSPSFVIGEQVRTVSTARLLNRLGAVSPATMGKVEFVLRTLLGL